MKPTLITIALIFLFGAAKAQKIDTIKGLRADTLVFTAVQDPPSFPGGAKAFSKFLAKNLKYPQTEVQGKVFVEFIVEKDGSLSRFRILRGITSETDQEAIRVMKLSPPWNPGQQNGHKVRVYWIVPINFSITE
ncbi:MAG: energy transducer TonB [Bacteroidetes bacterium]|nr:energy transducer TonB [Bacteroidota bacterium]